MDKMNKKPYSSPEIKKVDLTPEEAVLTGCKTAASPTGKNVGANSCGTRDNFCSTAVS